MELKRIHSWHLGHLRNIDSRLGGGVPADGVGILGVNSSVILQVLRLLLQPQLVDGLAQGGEQPPQPDAGLSVQVWRSFSLTQTSEIFVNGCVIHSSALLWRRMLLMISYPLVKVPKLILDSKIYIATCNKCGTIEL